MRCGDGPLRGRNANSLLKVDDETQDAQGLSAMLSHPRAFLHIGVWVSFEVK